MSELFATDPVACLMTSRVELGHVDIIDRDDNLLAYWRAKQIISLFERHKPKLVINVALPYQDLRIMDACLTCGVHYLDTANYEPPEEAKFEYSWQWAYQEKFKEAGLTAVLGCGFDPGVTGVFTSYAAKVLWPEKRGEVSLDWKQLWVWFLKWRIKKN